MSRIEKTILSNLIHNEEFCRKTIPFLKLEYFGDHFENAIADELINHFTEYNKPASLQVLAVQLGKRRDLRPEQLKLVEDYINDLTFKTRSEEHTSELQSH